MHMAVWVVGALLLGNATVTPGVLPARGRHEAEITLDRAGMVRLSVSGGGGTSCEVVDHLRGPFASAGRVGVRNCALDLLLDSGTYAIRLRSPRKGKGQLRVSAQPFAELNAAPQRLEPGEATEGTLPLGRQISYWIHLDKRGPVAVRVSGQTAGALHLWHSGEWLEDDLLRDSQVEPRAGQPIHEWWLEGTLEAGDYLLTAYGTAPAVWTEGAGSERLSVASGFLPAPASGATSLVLPFTGLAALELPAPGAAVTVDRRSTAQEAVEAALHAIDADGTTHLTDDEATCSIGAKALVPECALVTSRQGRRVLFVRGAPGAQVELRWSSYTDDDLLRDGQYSSVRDHIRIHPASSGDYAVGAHDVPPDSDAAPLSCLLLEEHTGPGPASAEVVASDFIPVSNTNPFRRSFNYEGSATIWFELTQPGLYHLETSGDRHDTCTLSRFDGPDRKQEAQGDKESCKLSQLLMPGRYELDLTGGAAGIEHLAIAPPLVGSGADTATKTACAIDSVHLEAGADYRLIFSRGGHATARGLTLRPASAPAEVARLEAPPVPRATAAFSPALQPPPELPSAREIHADFDREESRSWVFTVGDAGLYDVATTGLLATHCTIRTPVFPHLYEDTSGGRGRNCLIASYLRPGRYLLTVATVGRSRGRAGIEGTRRPMRVGPEVDAGKEAFFRTAAGELIAENLRVRRRARYHLTTTGQGVELGCRLEDDRGWPLVKLPMGCDESLALDPGRYGWIQLPLTVESLRHTKLERIRAPRVLKGKKTHPISLDRSYTVSLGPTGHDSFTFTLPADLDVQVTLTNGMQGRIYRVSTAGEEPVDLVPPQMTATPPPADENAEGGEGESPPEATEGGEGDEGEEEQAAPSPEASAPSEPPAAHVAHLAAGSYRLATEHSQGDVGITYELALGSDTLVPGVSKTLAVPSRATLRVPHDGTLRLSTAGETDVRCRLFDGTGKLVAESSSNGDDWNCALAEPFAAGDYTLVLESETQVPGSTLVTLASPSLRDVGPLQDGATLAPGADVLSATLALPESDAVAAVDLTSDSPFSCLVQGPSGSPLRQAGVRDCAAFVHAPGESWQVRVWTLGRPAQIHVGLALQPIASGRTPTPTRAALASIEQAGRYRTLDGAFCLPAGAHGLLRPCGPEVSLEAGPTLFAVGRGAPGEELPLEKIVAALDQPLEERIPLAARPFLERQRSSHRALHLLSIDVPYGEAAAPVCSVTGDDTGGVRELRPFGCDAASGAGRESLARWSAPTEVSVTGKVVRRALREPEAGPALEPGARELAWTGDAARFAFPGSSAEVELTLPAGSWAVQLDGDGRAVDLCAPRSEISDCVLGGKGGEVWIEAPGGHAQALVTLTGEPPAAVALAGLYETVAPAPGETLLTVAGAPVDRKLEVRGATGCLTALADGRRLRGCEATVPAGSAATVQLRHGAGPLRVLLYAAGARAATLLGPGPTGEAEAWSPGVAAPLSGLQARRSFRVPGDTAVHLRSEAGVCALLQDGRPLEVDGTAGCALDRVLPAGRYELLVRAFGTPPPLPLAGSAVWTGEPLQQLGDGVGPPSSLAPGQARLFGFPLASDGQVGGGLRAPADTLDCEVRDASGRTVGTGCQEFLALKAGNYRLRVRAPAGSAPTRFSPVLLGLSGSRMGVPQSYLDDFFARVGLPSREVP